MGLIKVLRNVVILSFCFYMTDSYDTFILIIAVTGE